MSPRAKALGKVGVHLLLPILVLAIPTSWVERGRSVCLIRAVTGRPCPGCGMTRAVSSAAHLRFRRALRHNRLVVVVLPLLVWEWVRSLQRAWWEYAVASYWAHPHPRLHHSVVTYKLPYE